MFITDLDQEDRVMKVLFVRNPPDAFDNCIKFPTISPTVECPFPGWCVEIIYYLAQYLNFTILPVVIQNRTGREYRKMARSTWSHRRRNRRHSLSLLSTDESSRDEFFLFRAYHEYTADVRGEWCRGCLEHNMERLQSIHELNLGVFILQTVYCMFVMNIEVKISKKNPNPDQQKAIIAEYKPLQMLWKMICIQLNQHESFEFTTTAGNFSIATFALLQCRLLLEMYSIVILSSLLQPSALNPFDDPRTMVKLISTNQYHLVTNYRNNWFFEELNDSNASHYKSLREAIQNNTVRIEHSVEHALRQVELNHSIFPTQEDSIVVLMARERCNLIFVSNDLIPQISSHLIFKFGSRFRQKFDVAIAMRYFTEGFRIHRVSHQCEDGDRLYGGSSRGRWHEGDEGFELKPLGLFSLSGVFVVMILGWSVSFLAFLAEFYHKWQKRMFVLRLRTRRALADTLQQTALAQYFAGPEVQQRVNEQLERPTIGEIQAHFGELYI